jgi:hypothetical protein
VVSTLWTYSTAEGLGKQIVGARLEDLGDTDITSQWQRCDLFADRAQTEIEVPGGPPVRFNTAALYQLRRAIEGSAVGPQPEGDDTRVLIAEDLGAAPAALVLAQVQC